MKPREKSTPEPIKYIAITPEGEAKFVTEIEMRKALENKEYWVLQGMKVYEVSGYWEVKFTYSLDEVKP